MPGKATKNLTKKAALINQFKTVYSSLNPAQKTAVDTIEGPVMVIAGPGTGKTQVLTTRIANILEKTDTNPRSILALTFTESAAKNMRERLVQLIGKTGYYVQISTFHAFCAEVLRDFPEYFPISRDSEPLSDLERYGLFENILDELELEAIKSIHNPYHYLRDIIKAISDLKREGVSLRQFKDMVAKMEQELEDLRQEDQRRRKAKKKDRSIKVIPKVKLARLEKNVAKNQELIQVYTEYQQRLRGAKRYDFDDMIALVVEAFIEHEELLSEYQENLHYFLVDEYQDTNSAQNTVVDLLAQYWQEETGQANVFVVGDPNQAIYRFQGASIENMLGFVERYPNALVVNLDIGYRCTQVVYDAAAQLIAENKLVLDQDKTSRLSLETNLQSSQKNSGPAITLTKLPSQQLEAVYLAEKIQELIKQGINPQEIAVLYRHNRDRDEIAGALDRWGIKYEVEGGGNALDEEIIRQLLTLFRVIWQLRHATEDADLYELFQYPWFQAEFDLDSTLLMKLARIVGRSNSRSRVGEPTNLLELIQDIKLKDINKHHPGHEITQSDLAPFRQVVKKLQRWDKADAGTTFNAWFEQVITESGYLNWLLAQPAQAYYVITLNSVFNEIKKLVAHQPGFKLADFLRAIETIQEHNLSIPIEDLNVKAKAVQLSTVHKAKGREWRYVFLAQVLDKKWGNSRNRDLITLPAQIVQKTNLDQKERNEDERRLFYVALTRAKEQVFISHPESLIIDSRTREVVGSMFLAELEEIQQRRTSKQSAILEHQASQEIVDQADRYLVKLLGGDENSGAVGADVVPLSSNAGVLSSNTRAYLRWLLKDFKISPTTLDAYLRDETEDKSEFLKNNILRIPRAKTESLMYGSAMHGAFERYYRQYEKEGASPSLKKWHDWFREALKQEVMTPKEHQRWLKKGLVALEKYHAFYAEEKLQLVDIERAFGGGRRQIRLGEIALSGKIDRIDWLEMKNKMVRVVDYKTGRPKTKNEVLGKTRAVQLSEHERALPESLWGAYKRQLLFYKLLVQLDTTLPVTVESGILDFVEPRKDNDKFVRHTFKLPDEEVAELKQVITDVWKEMKERWG